MDHASELSTFFRTVGLNPESLDRTTLAQTFLTQMRIGLYGGHSTVPILPTFLSPPQNAARTETVAVAWISSEEVHVACIRPDAGMGAEDAFALPGVDYPAPYSDLIFAIAELLEPLLSDCTRIALCWDVPLKTEASGEGSIAQLPEQIQLSGWAGRPLRADLAAELETRGVTGKEIVLMSTAAVAQAAAGLSAPPNARTLGLLWGKTVDVAFCAPASVVPKLKGAGGKGLMLLDTAAAAFCGLPCMTTELFLDRDSQKPGEDLYQKIVSTWTLGELYRFAILKAVEQDLLTFGCGRDFLSLKRLPFEQLCTFMREPEGENTLAIFCRDPADCVVAQAVAEAVCARAACVVGANLSAVMRLVGAASGQTVVIGVAGEVVQTPLLYTALEKQVKSSAASEISCILKPLERRTLLETAATLAHQRA